MTEIFHLFILQPSSQRGACTAALQVALVDLKDIGQDCGLLLLGQFIYTAWLTALKSSQVEASANESIPGPLWKSPEKIASRVKFLNILSLLGSKKSYIGLSTDWPAVPSDPEGHFGLEGIHH